MNSAASQDPIPPAEAVIRAVKVGRPAEIEEWSNRRLVHPLSRALAGALIPTGVTPNMVSVMGALVAAAAAGAYVGLAWPWSAVVGFGLHCAWHVLDGADGDLARRTGRASTNGEIIDGICDHVGQAVIYVALAVILSRSIGAFAWLLAFGAGVSRAVQASWYEGARRNYRRWVYGAGWIRQNLASADAVGDGPGGRIKAWLGRAYVALSARVSADDAQVEAAMAALAVRSEGEAEAARRLYGVIFLPVVKKASVLSANYRTLALFVSLLAGSPLYYFAFELVGLNLALLWLVQVQTRATRRIGDHLAAGGGAAGMPA